MSIVVFRYYFLCCQNATPPYGNKLAVRKKPRWCIAVHVFVPAGTTPSRRRRAALHRARRLCPGCLALANFVMRSLAVIPRFLPGRARAAPQPPHPHIFGQAGESFLTDLPRRPVGPQSHRQHRSRRRTEDQPCKRRRACLGKKRRRSPRERRRRGCGACRPRMPLIADAEPLEFRPCAARVAAMPPGAVGVPFVLRRSAEADSPREERVAHVAAGFAEGAAVRNPRQRRSR